MTLKIGPLKLSGRVLAAPFSGISNLPFRLMARRQGAAAVVTEMIKARPLVDGVKKTESLIETAEAERPVGMQLASGIPEEAARAARIARDRGFDFADLNLGCPVRKILKTRSGSYLMDKPALAHEIMAAMVRAAAPLPVTAKIRAGIDGEVTAVTIGRALADAGCALITIHARTRDMQHKGAPKDEVVAELKAAVAVPVVYNGGIDSPTAARRAIDATQCDGVMIGRASFGNPWIFERVHRYLETGVLDRTAPTLGEVRRTLVWHFETLIELFGERRACLLIRRYAAWYTRGLACGATFRRRVSLTATPAMFHALVQEAFGRFDPKSPAPLADFYNAPPRADPRSSPICG